jgi:hypothetical protein
MSTPVARPRCDRRVQFPQGDATRSLPPFICACCGSPIVRGQQIGPFVFSKDRDVVGPPGC